MENVEKEAKNYEIGFLLREEKDAKEIVVLLESHGAVILNEAKFKRIHLAYPIKKEIAAYFGFIHFSASPSVIKSLNEKLKLNSKILRFLIINLTAVSLAEEKAIKKSEKPTIKPRVRIIDETPKKNLSSDEFVDNELLEKKLEEILK